jgi:tetratricopeptide (TPR) repeat protein
MNLTSKLLKEIDNQELCYSERARLRCMLAKELEEAGNYEAARGAMGELWQHVGERPLLDGLDERTAAEVLMRAGALTGWIGSAKQIVGAQEIAKDLISESVSLFEKLADTSKKAEAQTELSYCYWREGAFDEARITLQEAFSYLTAIDTELKAIVSLRSSIVERSARRLNDALHILREAAPLFEGITNHSLKGRFHVGLATTLKNLGTNENREDYVDSALVEYSAASYHFEQAGHTSYRAAVENNLGRLFLALNRFEEAHEHLNRAYQLFSGLKDKVHSAQVNETRARALLAQGRNAEAERVVRSAVRTLEKGGEQALLAEALTTHGVANARRGAGPVGTAGAGAARARTRNGSGRAGRRPGGRGPRGADPD